MRLLKKYPKPLYYNNEDQVNGKSDSQITEESWADFLN